MDGDGGAARSGLARYGEALWASVASAAVALAVGGIVYSATRGELTNPCRGQHDHDVRLLATVGVGWALVVAVAPQVVVRRRGRLLGLAVGVLLALLPVLVVIRMVSAGLTYGGCD